MSGLKRTVLLTCAVGALSAGLARPAHADADPRDYEGIEALPDKTTLFLTYFRHITSSDNAGQSHNQLSENLILMRVAWTKKFGKLSIAPIDFILPLADVSVYAPVAAGSPANATIFGSGLGDLLYVATGVYALPENERNTTLVGASSYVTLPTGNYDREKAINIGAHRWNFKEELYVGQQFAKNFSIEAIGNVSAYTTNTAQSVPTGATTPPALGKLDQKPTFGFEAHFLADVASYFSVGASYYATANGRSYIGLESANISNETAEKQQTIQSLRGTVALRIEKQSLILFQYQNDIAASGDAAISRFFGVRVSHFFF